VITDQSNATYAFDPDALRRRRKRAGLTQAELADLCSGHVMSIRTFEIGKTIPSTRAILTICAALGCKPGDLFRELP
jgi:transcriptional regulator with XRE-family HTH domain